MIRAAASSGLVFSFLIIMLLAGCAAPGDPSPRRPVVPEKVSDLAASQYGSAMDLTFTLPTRSTDREALAEPPAIEIYRAALAPGAVPDRKTNWRLVYTIPSERVDSYLSGEKIDFHDPLTTDDFASAAGSSVAYKIRTRATKSRASEDSNVVRANVYAPPGEPRDVRVSVTEQALIVTWADTTVPSGATPHGYHVYRGEIAPGDESASQDASKAKLKMPLALVGSSTTGEFRDSHFEFGTPYLYTVRSVAQFGADLVESADSSPVTVTPRDTFPPAAPTRLEVSVIPATNQTPAYVESSWAISPEGDLGGYFVYRSNQEDTQGERISNEMLLSPTFRDNSVVSGSRYYYRVSAVDRSGNESPKSSAVQADIP
jgi:hypothetical protein